MPCLACHHWPIAVFLSSLSGRVSLVGAHDARRANRNTLRGALNTESFAGLEMASSFVQTKRTMRRMMSRDPEQLELWTDSNSAVLANSSLLPQSKLEGWGSSIDGAAFGHELHEFCDPFRSRFVGTNGNIDVARAIETKFKKYGLRTWTESLQDDSRVHQYLRNGTSGQNLGGNVIGRLEGTDLAHETVIVAAHFDSVNWENKAGFSPGVDDNGSGSAAVQLALRDIMKSGIKPRRSIMFVGFNAEEEGLVGSTQFARKAANGDYGNVKGVLIADEIAYPGLGKGDRKAIFETVGAVPGTKALVDTFAHTALLKGGDGIQGFVVNWHGFGSDHIPFLDHGIPAVLLIERNNIQHADDFGHSDRDNFDHVDFAYGAAMSRLLSRAAATLASPANSNEFGQM